MKNNRHGKAKVWNPNVIRKMRSRLVVPAQKLIFEISLFTGERVGAIVQLQVNDVFDESGKVKDYITFLGSTRKSSKHGIAQTRQVTVHPDLKLHLSSYELPSDRYLFPSPNSRSRHITRRAVDKYWRNILRDYGFNGFSTHSSRRWVINQLRSNGTEISVIAETMAIDINTVRRYLNDNPIACQKAIATLTV